MSLSDTPLPLFAALAGRVHEEDVSYPGTLFGDTDDRYVRMSLLQPIERLKEAMERIMEAKERLFIGATAAAGSTR